MLTSDLHKYTCIHTHHSTWVGWFSQRSANRNKGRQSVLQTGSIQEHVWRIDGSLQADGDFDWWIHHTQHLRHLFHIGFDIENITGRFVTVSRREKDMRGILNEPTLGPPISRLHLWWHNEVFLLLSPFPDFGRKLTVRKQHLWPSCWVCAWNSRLGFGCIIAANAVCVAIPQETDEW